MASLTANLKIRYESKGTSHYIKLNSCLLNSQVLPLLMVQEYTKECESIMKL